MKNLAGVETCDDDIRLELAKAGITAFDIKKGRSEVPYSVVGLLGHKEFSDDELEFFKMMECNITLASFTFTRSWYYWSVTGYVPLEVADIMYANPNGVKEIRAGGDCACRPPSTWVEKTLVCGKQVVSNYHIDTQEGLNYFVQTLKEHGLVGEVAK